jgi:hypothetical protein
MVPPLAKWHPWDDLTKSLLQSRVCLNTLRTVASTIRFCHQLSRFQAAQLGIAMRQRFSKYCGINRRAGRLDLLNAHIKDALDCGHAHTQAPHREAAATSHWHLRMLQFPVQIEQTSGF